MARDEEGPFEWRITSAIEFTLPLTAVHEPHLRALISSGSPFGSAALKRLVSIHGEHIKAELLPLIFERRDDYNFCRNGLAEALRPFVSDADARRLARWADEIEASVTPNTDEDEYCVLPPIKRTREERG